MSDYTTFSATFENLIFVTHSVPFERVRPHVPPAFELDTIEGPEHENVALVTAMGFLNRDPVWQPSGETAFDFHQAMYLTYIKSELGPAVYLFSTYVERGVPGVLEHSHAKGVYPADFDVSLSHDPISRAYKHYYLELDSEKGAMIIEAQSKGEAPKAITPFPSGMDLAKFITERPVQFHKMPGGRLGTTRLEFEPMDPIGAELLGGEFDLWERLAILREEEFDLPYSTLIQPSVAVTAYPPEVIE